MGCGGLEGAQGLRLQAQSRCGSHGACAVSAAPTAPQPAPSSSNRAVSGFGCAIRAPERTLDWSPGPIRPIFLRKRAARAQQPPAPHPPHPASCCWKRWRRVGLSGWLPPCRGVLAGSCNCLLAVPRRSGGAERATICGARQLDSDVRGYARIVVGRGSRAVLGTSSQICGQLCAEVADSRRKRPWSGETAGSAQFEARVTFVAGSGPGPRPFPPVVFARASQDAQSTGRRRCQSVASWYAQPMRSAIASS